MSRPNFRDKHLYILIALFAACTLIYYFGELVNFFGWEALRWNIWYTVHDPDRMLFLFPILYCSYYYSLRGALLSNIISLVMFLPRALFISPFPDPTLRMIIFVLFSTALSTIMALVLIGRDKPVKLPDQVRPVATKYQNMPRTLLLIFVFMSAGILVAGYLFYSNYEKNYRTQIENQLSSIANLKAGELVQWRKERLADANQFFKNSAFSSLAQRYLENADDLDAQEQLRPWLTAFQVNYQYARVFLLDTQGAGRIIIPDTGQPLPHHTLKDAQQALQSGKVTFLDLHRDEEGQRPHAAVLVPLFREEDGNLPLGVLVMLIDPDTYLYPLINRWPTASTTAETLIVRRDGNDALFLNELRFQKDAALKLRIPLDKKDVPAVQAVLGKEGIMEGVDYRGEPVLADVRSIPDSPWFMVARMDMSEIYAPLTQILWMVIALVGALLIGAGASVGLIWRQQNVRVYQERAEIAEALSASEARYRDLFENASLAVFRSTLEGKVLAVNPKFASIFGYKSQEEVVATIKDIATDLYVDPHRREEIARLSKDNPDLNKFEVLYSRKDASTFWGELTIRIATESDGATFFEGFIEDITERKKAEELLRESEGKHRAVVEMASDVIVIIQDGIIRFANPRVTTMFGYETGEIEGMEFVSFIPPENLGLTLERYQKRMAGEKLPEIYETVLLHKSGRKIPVETSGSAIEWAGKPADLAIIRDITERKQAEQALRESEAQYRLLSEHMTDTVWLMNMNLETTYQSPSVLRVRGFTPQEIEEMPLEKHLAPESLKIATDVFLTETAQVEADPNYNFLVTLELEFYRKDGSSFWSENTFSLIRDENGRPLSILGEGRDVTERKKAEDALRETEEKYRSLVENAVEGICVLQDGLLKFVNPALAAIAGLSIDEMTNKLITDYVYPDDREMIFERESRRISGEKFDTYYDFRALNKQGQVRWLSLNAILITWEGKPATLNFLEDITERKKAEELRQRERTMLERTEGIAHVGSWEWDIATDTVTWSDELFRIFQRDPQEGAPSFAEHPAFYHPDDFAFLKQAVETAIADGTPYALELRAIRKNGETRVCMARGVAEMGPGKRPVRLFGSLQDITERKQAEETLRQEKQFSESLVDTAQMIVLVLNTSGQIVTFNPYMEEISGYKLEESIGKDWFSTFLPEAKQAKTRNVFSIALTDSKTKGNVDEIVTKDGRILSIEWYDKTLKDTEGNIIGLLSVGQDITERRLSSEKLTKSYESIKKTLDDAINTMVKIVERRDPYTAGHQQKVAQLATAIAGEMKFDDTQIEQLRTAAVIHDIGKIYVSSDILSRPGKLTDMEFALIKTHVQNGYDIVKGMDFPGAVAETILQHHERLDGSGYPNGLKAEDTLMKAKILAVADVVEAMASHRPYRPALGVDKALQEISWGKGKIYDPDVVDACLELFNSGKFEFKIV